VGQGHQIREHQGGLIGRLTAAHEAGGANETATPKIPAPRSRRSCAAGSAAPCARGHLSVAATLFELTERATRVEYPVDGTFGAAHDGRCRPYVRPRDIAVGTLTKDKLPGTIVNAHRTAAGRRAAIAVANAKDLIEAEIDITASLTIGEQVGLSFAKGKVFAE
jgi:hypothetical protein